MTAPPATPLAATQAPVVATPLATVAPPAPPTGKPVALPTEVQTPATPVAVVATPAPVVPAPTAKPVTVALTLSVDLSGATSSSSFRRSLSSLTSGPQSAQLIAVTSAGTVSTVANCRTCQVTMSVAPGPVTIVATSYDGANGAGSALGTSTAATLAGAGASTLTFARWAAIVAAVAFTVQTPLTDGSAGTSAIEATAFDADGDTLTGSTPFTTPVGLSLVDPAHAYALSATSFANPAQNLSIAYDGAPGARSDLVPSLPGVTIAAFSVPVAVPPYAVRAHSLTFDQANGSPADYNAAFGFNNFAYAAKYVDLMLSPPGTVAQLTRAAGIKTMGYVDLNLCSGAFKTAPNPYAHPDCAQLGNDAFYTEDGYPDRPIAANYNGQTTDRLGNPQSPALQAAALAAIQGEIASSGNEDAILVDDAMDMETLASLGDRLCYGDGTVSNGGYSCAGSSGGDADYPYAQSYSEAGWIAGMTQFAATIPRPVIFNGLGGTNPRTGQNPALAVMLATPNSWGGLCEGCFYGTNPYVNTSPILDNSLQSSMTATAAGKNVGVLDDTILDPVQRQRAMADIMLFYDPDHTYIGGEPCGAKAMIHECPEQALTFYQPVLPYPTTPSAVKQSTGAYAREFRACYAGGVALGPCAAVVNPNTTASLPLPAFSQTYAHTLTISGDSLCNCFGATGFIAATGPAAPATLPGASGYVLFR